MTEPIPGDKELKILSEVIRALDNAPRMGAQKDSPEGSMIIEISDILARKMANDLNDVGMFIIDLRSKTG